MGGGEEKGLSAELDGYIEKAQPLADAIEVAGAQYDVARAAIGKMVDPFIASALRALGEGDHTKAAIIFEKVADEYRACNLRGDADQWAHRAADCRSAARHAKRRAKKGKGR